MGASMALAGFGLTSCRRPEAHLVPFTKSVEWAIPGKALFYATAMPRRTGAIPLVVTTHDGRPTKVDGNPLHPASGGATDTFAQASILDLYDPARSKRFVERTEKIEGGKKVEDFETRDRAAFEKYLTRTSLEDCGRWRGGSRISGRGSAFANARTFARGAAESFPEDALVRV